MTGRFPQKRPMMRRAARDTTSSMGTVALLLLGGRALQRLIHLIGDHLVEGRGPASPVLRRAEAPDRRIGDQLSVLVNHNRDRHRALARKLEPLADDTIQCANLGVAIEIDPTRLHMLLDAGIIAVKAQHRTVRRDERPVGAPPGGQPRMLHQMTMLAMHRHGDPRFDRGIDLGEILLPGMSGDMDPRLLGIDHAYAHLGELVVEPVDRRLVPRDRLR